MRLIKIGFVFSGICAFNASAFCQEAVSKSHSVADVLNDKNIFTANIDTARKLLDIVAEFFVKYSFQALGGVIILVIGWYLSKILAKIAADFFKQHGIDVTVSKFLIEMLKLTVMALAVLIALGNFGITIAPFIAGLSVAGFGLSFALQGPLSNYAAGATLIFTKPFKVGDIIEVTGVMGEVEDMTLARTEVKTIDGTKIVIPNKQIIGEIIHNFSEHKKIDIKIGISYSADPDRAVAIVKDVIAREVRITKTPAPKIGISTFGGSSVDLYARVWAKQADYWDVLFDVNRAVFSEFKKNGIDIPHPQIDVHMR
ncbi:MAG TPA: mechanosensitive ion channel [Candidatus Omnitrophota bacterium]|nr:mechanosensitive ion channel [Candidatus Omnitrophota bacterium]HPS20318.1 mechanosensitive ion channel [Candidatus Omnitrophota bacterium]